MLSDKNSSPQQLAIISAGIVALIGGVTYFFIQPTWTLALGGFLLLFIVSYLTFFYFLKEFMYRRIKIIYKLIAETKATRREEFYAKEILPPKSIVDVEQEVQKWAMNRNKKIESLESNEKFRKDFLLNLTHELKTPIFAAQNYIETLQDGALEDETVNHVFLEKAGKSINRLVLLVEDLDEISKYESNEIQLKKKNFIIQDLIKEIFEELRFKQEAKQIKLLIKPGCETPVTIYGDVNKIRQVLVNLIENSIKYGKENGETNAGIYNVDKQTVLVEINDNGYGISEEHVPRIFERFFRTDTARSRKVGGSGLGLSIVKHIVEAHGGSVHCRSTLDVGTTIGFTLPRA